MNNKKYTALHSYQLINTIYNPVVILKASSGIIRTDRKLLYDNDEEILFEYFKLINDKNINRLLNLFSPDAIVYEPIGKLRRDKWQAGY
jgi:hypothetical protein